MALQNWKPRQSVSSAQMQAPSGARREALVALLGAGTLIVVAARADDQDLPVLAVGAAYEPSADFDALLARLSELEHFAVLSGEGGSLKIDPTADGVHRYPLAVGLYFPECDGPSCVQSLITKILFDVGVEGFLYVLGELGDNPLDTVPIVGSLVSIALSSFEGGRLLGDCAARNDGCMLRAIVDAVMGVGLSWVELGVELLGGSMARAGWETLKVTFKVLALMKAVGSIVRESIIPGSP